MDYTYVTFDDVFLLSAAKKDPVGFIQGLKKPVIIDEVQKAPEIFISIKKDVDENRNPADIYSLALQIRLIPRIGDSLAGRMAILHLTPLSQGELSRAQTIYRRPSTLGLFLKKYSSLSKEELIEKLMRGGFPEMQTDDEKLERCGVMVYLTTILQRDVQDLAHIDGIKNLQIYLEF